MSRSLVRLNTNPFTHAVHKTREHTHKQTHCMKLIPEVLKTGKITPIYKKDDPQQFGNYRPVSVLPIFSKSFEKIIYSRLHSFLTTMKANLDFVI